MPQPHTSPEWRAIPDWPYEASEDGQIRRLGRSPLKAEVSKGGYARVVLSDGTRRWKPSVHRLVALAFLGVPPPGQEVRHLDGKQHNNAVTNLAYGTKLENRRDRIIHGTDHQLSKTHCPQGHPYSPENTYRAARGDRQCRACHRERERVRARTRKHPNPAKPDVA